MEENNKLKKILKANSQKSKPEDVEKTLENEQKINEKAKKVPRKFTKMINQLKLFMELLKDYSKGDYREIPWGTVSVIVAAIAYFVAPIDLLPDILPMVGFLDDALLFTTAIGFIQDDLKHYCVWKGKDPEQYF